jgi:hypothetical protein
VRLDVTVANRLRIALAVLAIGLMTSCSGIRQYPNTLAKNVRIRTDVESGSIFSSTRARVGIYRVDAQCRVEYEGTIELDQPVVLVGLPPDRLNYLVFSFLSSSWVANARGSMRQATFFRTRSDHSYEIEVGYRRSLYNVVLREQRPGKSGRREIELTRADACRARSAIGRGLGRSLASSGRSSLWILSQPLVKTAGKPA